MKPQAFRPSVLVLLLAAAFAHMQAAADTSAELETIEIKARSRDQRGADDVYRKNVSSVYAGREYLERYRTDAAGDVFKGLNGVYNMNTRNAGSAITPNIRGISGKGRIPVTIDGTEQTVDVWMNNYGIADRNYVDPALFRSITVEKGPAMTRGVKSGVGGAVSIRTIEPADIIPEGKSWGVEVKTEFSNNTAKPLQNLNDYLGKDYRTLPGNPTADGASGALGGNVPFAGLNFYGTDADKPRQSSRFAEFKNDRNLLFSAAFKTDLSDGLVAYSDRRKGTYFSGKRGASGYLNNAIYDSEDPRADRSDALIPDMADLYRPGEQVPNSNVSSRSLLVKKQLVSAARPANQPALHGHQNPLRRDEPLHQQPAAGLGQPIQYAAQALRHRPRARHRLRHPQPHLQTRLPMAARRQPLDRPQS